MKELFPETIEKDLQGDNYIQDLIDKNREIGNKKGLTAEERAIKEEVKRSFYFMGFNDSLMAELLNLQRITIASWRIKNGLPPNQPFLGEEARILLENNCRSDFEIEFESEEEELYFNELFNEYRKNHQEILFNGSPPVKKDFEKRKELIEFLSAKNKQDREIDKILNLSKNYTQSWRMRQNLDNKENKVIKNKQEVKNEDYGRDPREVALVVAFIRKARMIKNSRNIRFASLNFKDSKSQLDEDN